MATASSLHSGFFIKISDCGFCANLVFVGRARADANAANDLAIDEDWQASANDAEVPTVGDVDAEGGLARLAKFVVNVCTFSSRCTGKSFVDGNRNTADLAAIHAVKFD